MAAVYVADGVIIPEKQYADGKVKVEIAEGASGVSADRADGLMLTSEDYTADGVVVTGDKTFTFGGKKQLLRGGRKAPDPCRRYL